MNTAKDPLSLTNTTTFGRYSVISLLGEGGMGSVYLALDPILQRKVALKVIRLDPHLDLERREEFLHRFQTEAKSVAQLHFPSIVTIFDTGNENGTPWIAFEFVDGESLFSLLKRTKVLPVKQALTIAADIAEALYHAHSCQIIHRDIKPANILIDKLSGRAKLTDFGVAKAPFAMHTSDGIVVGSPGYMAPEQIDGLIADWRADIFSLGVVLYEMLSGHHPFLRETFAATAFATVKGEVPLLSQFTKDIPPNVEALVSSMLITKRKQRMQNANECQKALKNFLSNSVLSNNSLYPAPLQSTIHDDLSLFQQRFAPVKAGFIRFLRFGISGTSTLLHVTTTYTGRCIRFFQSGKFPPLSHLILSLKSRSETLLRFFKTIKFKIGLSVFLLLLVVFLGSNLWHFATTTVRYDDAFLASQNPQEYMPVWPTQKVFNAAVLLLTNKKFDDAEILATALLDSKKTEAHGMLLLAWIKLKDNNCIESAPYFENTRACLGGVALLNNYKRTIVDDCIMRYAKTKLEESCTKTFVTYISAQKNPMVRSWIYSKEYWKRWNAVNLMREAQKKVDMAAVYMLDLQYASSMSTRITAAEELGALKARKAIPLLKRMASYNSGNLFVSMACKKVLQESFNLSLN